MTILRRPGPAAMLMAIVLATILAPEAQAQAIAGRVLDMSTGQPVSLARVSLLDLENNPLVYTFTDSLGLFLVEAPGPGQYRLGAEAAFHQTQTDGPITLVGADTLSLVFGIRPNPVMLDGITVEAERRHIRLELEGFYGREETRAGFYFDRDDFQKWPGRPVSDMLAAVPGVNFRRIRGETIITFRRQEFLTFGNAGTCHPQVFMNGLLLMPGGQVPSQLDRIPLDQLVGVEVYQTTSGLPGRFSGMNERCGTIAVWTR